MATVRRVEFLKVRDFNGRWGEEDQLFVAMPNFAAIDQTVTEISIFSDFQDGGCSPC